MFSKNICSRTFSAGYDQRNQGIDKAIIAIAAARYTEALGALRRP
jgi:hypothetical protein